MRPTILFLFLALLFQLSCSRKQIIACSTGSTDPQCNQATSSTLGGSVNQEASAPPTCTLAANSLSLQGPGPVSLLLSVPPGTKVTQVALDTGDPITVGQPATVNVSATHTFTAVVANSAGKNNCQVTVEVSGVSATAPQCQISASPDTINAGQSSTLTMNISDASQAVLNGQGISLPPSPVVVTPATTTTYLLQVSGSGGLNQCSTTVTVQAAPPPPTVLSCTLSTDNATPPDHGSANLSWQSNANLCFLSGPGITSLVSGAGQGTYQVTSLEAGDLTYTASCYSSLNDPPVQCNLTLHVSNTSPLIAAGLVTDLDATVAQGGKAPYTPGCNGGELEWFDSSTSMSLWTLVSFSNCGGGSGWNGTGGNDPFRLTFDGLSNYVALGNNGLLQQVGFTQMAWIRPVSFNQHSYGAGVGGTIFDAAENESGSYAWGMRNDGRFWWWPDPGEDKFSVGTVPLGQWTFVTLSYDGAAVRMYINANLDSTQNSATPKPPTFLKVGAKSWTTGYFNGDIAEIAIYDRVLSTLEISQNCKAMVALYPGANCY